MSNFTDVVRIPPPVRRMCDLHELLKAVQILLSGECETRNITWQWELSPQPFKVELDVQQMEQVLVNACKNAIEAIGENGQLTVNTMNSTGKRLIIRDTGKGISKDIRSNLFTPFFSTKKNGQGIGLTLIKEILVNHGFSFSLESSKNGFTEFTIDFE